MQEIKRRDVEKETAAKVAAMRFKASVRLSELEDTERKLASQHDFKQATEVSARAARQRKLEEAAFQESKRVAARRPMEALTQVQQAEMQTLMHKCHALRLAVRREREQDSCHILGSPVARLSNTTQMPQR